MCGREGGVRARLKAASNISGGCIWIRGEDGRQFPSPISGCNGSLTAEARRLKGTGAGCGRCQVQDGRDERGEARPHASCEAVSVPEIC